MTASFGRRLRANNVTGLPRSQADPAWRFCNPSRPSMNRSLRSKTGRETDAESPVRRMATHGAGRRFGADRSARGRHHRCSAFEPSRPKQRCQFRAECNYANPRRHADQSSNDCGSKQQQQDFPLRHAGTTTAWSAACRLSRVPAERVNLSKLRPTASAILTAADDRRILGLVQHLDKHGI